ncbi:hypothetical protein ACN27J_23930 [Solwaraspora sp. WMMB762]|uniref:hypothetical protein n=1 Tax=Solwaraspora sp. WMMB762 TaxID=3404120 RepID=UPI003B92D0DD
MIGHGFLRPGTIAVATLGLAAALIAGCGQNGGTPSAATAPTVVKAHPYKIESDLPNALAFFGNTNVFEGTVDSVLPNVHAVDVLDTGETIEAVYTPVTITIDTVYRGKLKAGSEVTIRSMGGEAGGISYVIHEAPAKETFQPGSRVVIFGGELARVDSESAPAITPNFVYQQVGGEFVDATYADGPTNGDAPSAAAVAEVRAQLRALPSAPQRD